MKGLDLSLEFCESVRNNRQVPSALSAVYVLSQNPKQAANLSVSELHVGVKARVGFPPKP